MEDFGQALGLTAQVVQALSPERVCGYMRQALQSLSEALEQTPQSPVRQLQVLPAEKHRQFSVTLAALPQRSGRIYARGAQHRLADLVQSC